MIEDCELINDDANVSRIIPESARFAVHLSPWDESVEIANNTFKGFNQSIMIRANYTDNDDLLPKLEYRCTVVLSDNVNLLNPDP